MIPYSVETDVAARTVDVRLSGLWTLPLARAYVVEIERAATALRRRPGATSWLIDMTDLAVQPREIADFFLAAMPGLIPADATVARVHGGTLSSMQTRRVSPDPSHENFPSVAAARAWLTAKRTSLDGR